MKKNISKILVAIMVFNMMLGVGMVSDVYAVSDIITYKCAICNKEFHVAEYGSSDAAQAAAEAHESTCKDGSSGTSITLENSSLNVQYDTLNKTDGTDYFVDEDTNNWQDGSITEETRVTVTKESTFEIVIPKEVVLDGSTGTADYKVKVKGDIAGDQKITVTPDANFVLSEAGGKANVTATVTQPNTEYDYVKLQGDGTEYNGDISATLTAGEWSGKFNFNIAFTN